MIVSLFIKGTFYAFSSAVEWYWNCTTDQYFSMFGKHLWEFWTHLILSEKLNFLNSGLDRKDEKISWGRRWCCEIWVTGIRFQVFAFVAERPDLFPALHKTTNSRHEWTKYLLERKLTCFRHGRCRRYGRYVCRWYSWHSCCFVYSLRRLPI